MQVFVQNDPRYWKRDQHVRLLDIQWRNYANRRKPRASYRSRYSRSEYLMREKGFRYLFPFFLFYVLIVFVIGAD